MSRVRALFSPLAFPALVACAVLAPLAVHWLAGRTLAWFDTLSLYAPQRWIVDEALRAFRLPRWNPYMGAGMPFLADAIHGVLHPISVLAAWVGGERSVDLMIGGYVACAGLGALALARELGASRSGAALAAVVYGCSGFVLSMSGNLVFLAGAGSLPFCLAGLRRFAAEPRPGNLALGVAGTAVLALSGDAQALAVGGVLALALAWEAGGWRGAARTVAAGCVGLLVAGVQLVPTAVHLPRTERFSAEWDATPGVWAFEPWRIAELALPGLLWGPDPLMDTVYGALAGPGRWPGGGLPFPFAASVFVGLLPLVLAAAGVRVGGRGRLMGALALLLLWIALGPALGAAAILGRVPVWSAFRYSEKLVGPLTLILAALAGLGLDAVVERRVSGRWVVATAAALGLASIAGCLLAVSGLSADVATEAGVRLLRGALHVGCAGAALGGWLLLRSRFGGAGGRVTLAILVWGAMVAASPAALRPGDPAARLAPPGPALEAKPPGARIVTPYTYEPLALEPGGDWIDLSARDHAASGYAAWNVRSRLDSMSDYEAMVPSRLAKLHALFGERWPAVARRYGVTHVVVDPPRSEAHRVSYELATGGGVRRDSGSGPGEIWAVPHRDWASFPPEVRVVEGERPALLETARSFALQDAAVIVEAGTPFLVGTGRVLSLERGLESLRVEAESDADATLVVNDAWWPGWEATIDGAGATIFRADALVRAVRWPAGRHVLEMRYRPPEVRTGLLMSGLGLAALAVWTALLRRAVTRSRTSPSRQPPSPTATPPGDPGAAASPPAP